jgi:hypothetical protein
MRTVALLSILALLVAGCAETPPPGIPSDFSGLDLAPTATTGIIRGVVVDEAVRPVANATIRLTPGDARTTSTADGLFGFANLAPGTYFLAVTRPGYNPVQASTDVVAGVAEPPIVKVLLTANATLAPYVDALRFQGFLSFGAAVGITSVGTTINPTLSEVLQDTSIWTVTFDTVPQWAQGELLWEHNQAGGGMLIWEMVVGGTNDFKGYRETAESPALAYWNTSVLEAEAENVTSAGIAYRFFGGAHPLLAPSSAGGTTIPPEEQCPTVPTVVLGNRNPCRFGYGLTVQQSADAYVHHFYNFAPPLDWRFTVDGNPVVPGP